MRKAQKKHTHHTSHTHHTHRITDESVVVRVNEVITRSKQREGVKREKYALIDKRYRQYCETYNATNTHKTHNTHGGWQQPKRWASGKSQWERWAEEELAEKDTAIDEVLHRHGLAHHTAAVILYDKTNGQAGAIVGRVHSTPDKTYITVPRVPQLKIRAHRLQTDEWDTEDTVTAEGEVITMGELVKTAMQYRAEIYILE